MKGKKIIIIILVAVLSIAIVLIAGRDYFFPERPVSVESVEFEYDTDKLVVDLTQGTATITLKYKVLPENATNKKVSFISDSDFIVVTDEGVVTVNGMRSGTITVVTEDGNKEDIISIFSRSTGVINVGYSIENNSFTPSGDNSYIIDDDTLVLYSQNKYSLGIDGILDFENFSEFFDFSDGVINAKKFSGEGMTLTVSIGDEQRTIKVKIIDQTVLALSSTLNTFYSKANFLKAPVNFSVGTGSDFTFEFSVIAQSNVVETEDIHYRIYDMTATETLLGSVEFESGEENTETVNNYVQFKSFNTLRFLSGAEGKKIKLRINYRYDTALSKEFIFIINNGVNAATEAEFRQYFDEKDESYWTLIDKSQYGTINIVKSFEAVVPEYLLNTDRKTILNTYDLSQKYGGGWHAARLYTRVSPVVLNGNFNNIDCTKLPLARKFLGIDNNSQEEQYADNGRSVTALGFGRVETILKQGDPGYLDKPYYYDNLIEGETLFTEQMAKKFYDAAPKHYINDLSIVGNGGRDIQSGGEYIGARTVTAITNTYNKLYVENCYFAKVYSGITVDRASAEVKLKNIKITDTAANAIALRCTAASTLENLDISNGGFAAIYCMAGSSNKLMDRLNTEVFEDIVPGAKAGASMVYFKGFLNVDNLISDSGAQIGMMGYADIATQMINIFKQQYSTYANRFTKTDTANNITYFNFIVSRDEVTSTNNHTVIDLSGLTGYKDSYNENAFMSAIGRPNQMTAAFENSIITDATGEQTTQLFGANINAGLLIPTMRNDLSHFVVGLIPVA